MSSADDLTGFVNRAALNDILDASFRVPGIGSDKSAIGLIDVDRFKQINDTFGHSAGDRTLQKMSETMRAYVRDQGRIGRYGGGEKRSTLSIGAAMYSSDTSTSAMWLHLADEAM